MDSLFESEVKIIIDKKGFEILETKSFQKNNYTAKT